MINAMLSTLKLTDVGNITALNGVVHTGSSNDASSSPIYYLLFSSVFFLLLNTTLSYSSYHVF